MERISFSLYINQVGGHVPLLRSSSGKVCKPLSDKELAFYESLPRKLPSLQRFVPKFYGLIDLNVDVPASRRSEPDVQPPATSPSGPSDETDELVESFREMWSWRCQQSRVRKLGRSGLSLCKYIMLEDLACGFAHPCILDVKMGRRQYVRNASPEKLARQLEKSHSTTSYALGFRLCGLQVYYPGTSTYIFRDKYWGRQVAVDQITTAMAEFFFDGIRIRIGLIPAFVARLRELRAAIAAAASYRFYSSSLLFLYDGGTADDALCARLIDVRMIDFAHILEVDDPAPDTDYLYGIDHLIETLETVLELSKSGDLASPAPLATVARPRAAPSGPSPSGGSSKSQADAAAGAGEPVPEPVPSPSRAFSPESASPLSLQAASPESASGGGSSSSDDSCKLAETLLLEFCSHQGTFIAPPSGAGAM